MIYLGWMNTQNRVSVWSTWSECILSNKSIFHREAYITNLWEKNLVFRDSYEIPMYFECIVEFYYPLHRKPKYFHNLSIEDRP